MMREEGMGLDQSSPKSALVINNVALLVALVGGYHQLSWIISGNSIPNTAIKRSKDAVERVMEANWTRSEKLNLAQ